MVRAPRFDINGMKKGAWSEDEDNKLTAYIQQHGYPANWRELPKLAGLSRCGKSCRLRWKNHLDPTKKHGKFTKEEEDKIILLHKKFGNKWSMMAAQMPGRSDTEIKNHFNTRLKNRIPLDPDVSNNQHCDQNLEPQDHVANPKSTTQQEIDVLIAVLSSSSINKDSSPCQSSGHATDLPVIIPSDDILRVSDTAGDVWTDELFNSPLRVGCDFVPFETSWPDYNVMDDLVLWSTLFQSPDPPVDPVKLPVFSPLPSSGSAWFKVAEAHIQCPSYIYRFTCSFIFIV